MELNINIQGETLNVTAEILDRYNVPGPRYTSYPTAPEWLDTFGPADYDRTIRESNRQRPLQPLSLYMHLPFCERLCLFCGCNVVINRDHEVSNPYLQKLKWEIDQVASRLDTSRPVVQLHWGGGTPTYLSAAQIEDLFLFARDRFAFAPDAELGIEVDPRVTSEEQARTLRRLGFNRISMGVQDFTPIVQQTIHRVQPYEQTKALFDLCRTLGFESINIDLIYGLPHQTPETFVASVDKVIGMGPDRVAMFSYAHVPWLKKQQGSFAKLIPQGMDKFQIFRSGIERFTQAGYLYVGMDHFARPDDELCVAQRNRTLHRNFQGYTTKAGADLFGVGVSSISGVDRVYAQNYRDLKSYYGAVDGQHLPTMRGIGLNEDDVIRRAVISRILCHCVLHKDEIEQEFNLDFDEYFADELVRLKPLVSDGLIDLTPGMISVTSLGRIFIRNVGMVFDKYLLKPKDKPVFSKTL
ncbi:MAG TPA: oxygen-independent coproporphyrinogen III oxidase [Acidobacteriota bacterium]|nr:oxygen-independent coproporphyrinogen III oxidase [Acidobacteriota bacterium]